MENIQHNPSCSSCSCDSHDHDSKLLSLPIILGIGLVIIALLLPQETLLSLLLYLLSYLMIGGDVLLASLRKIRKGQIFDENFLMAIATIGAFAIREYPEAIAVMLFYQIGEWFQEKAVKRSRRSITDLMDLKPESVLLKTNGEFISVSPESIQVNDIILVKPGEKIPLDGIVMDGNSSLDTAFLTGESLPQSVSIGDSVCSGSINLNGVLTLQVSKIFSESTASKILQLIEGATINKAKTERFLTRFAKVYTPIVVLIAFLLASIPPLFFDQSFEDWLYRSLVFLVVSCPCALVVSIPLGFFGGIGAASKNGILVKGDTYLEALNNVKTVVFDKTGTLTQGVFKVTEINPAEGLNSDDLLQYAAYAEAFSNHPIANSIRKAYAHETDHSLLTDYEEIAGHGVRVNYNQNQLLAGNIALMDLNSIQTPASNKTGTLVYLAMNGRYIGSILISDSIKKDSLKTIQALQERGIHDITLLTGDRSSIALQVAQELGITQVQSELLPQGKLTALESILKNRNSKNKTVFIGDGMNDAPVLARADIGIAMGGIGSDAAIEAADIVFMTDEPYKLITALKIARKTKTIVYQNIFFAFGVKLIVLVLGAFSVATMWEAVFADVGVALLAILNAMRMIHGFSTKSTK